MLLLLLGVVLRWIVVPEPTSALAALERLERWRIGLEVGGALFLPVGLTVAVIARILRRHFAALAFLALCVVASLAVGVSLQQRRARWIKMPHILLLTLDGFNADRMALYGAARAPTPFLDTLGKRSLVGRNFFPQACCTASGTLALLTGRPPLELGVLYPPHQLRELDQYRSLITLLAARGYRTVQLTEPHYSDANELRLRGFDRVNGQQRGKLWFDDLPGWTRGHAWALIELERRLFGRAIDPLPLGVVASGPEKAKDKLDELLLELDSSTQPLFAHLHFLESHGPQFQIAAPLFSRGIAPQQDWMSDYYDDALRELDDKIAAFFAELERKGLMNSVMVVVTSDHGSRWSVVDRIPLLLAAPGLRPRSVLQNAQPIDVAPTLLSLLGLRSPQWMMGRSLVGPRSPDPWRTILSVQIFGHSLNWLTERWQIEEGTLNRGAHVVNVIVCDRHFAFNLYSGELTEKRLPGMFAACVPQAIPTAAALLRTLVPYLQQFGYTPDSRPFVGITVAEADKLKAK